MSGALRSAAAPIVALVAVAGLALGALTLGPLPASPIALLGAAFGGGDATAQLALSLRLPAVLTALVVGAGLALAGATLQGLFRNPLASPDLLGVSSGAAAGAALALLTGLAPWAVQGAAFLGGISAGALALAVAAAVRGADPRLALILCGVVVGALAAALLGVALIIADPYAELPTLTWWLLGAFSRASLPEALAAGALTALAGTVLLALGPRLDALALGEDQARALGLPARTLRLIALAAAALATSAVVSISGLVGWIGLLAPHAARLLVGETAVRLLPMSALLGAALALIVGQLARAFGPAEIPVGLLTALIGAPAFLALFLSGAGRRP
ncbi:MAG TPA: iron ABC transporter permease [Brevundimonas sp.]|uniref:FecCD family ABC transporter permease n=1 Tax=Brevundimonas sp. TaxID=1871086 RepID=UPI002E11C316|nr:iron ABC transporter permease [Brevundimonas sp.]